MPYATQDDLVPRRLSLKQLTQLTSDSAAATAPNTDVVSEELVAASAVVDGYCRQRYTLPLHPSQIVRDITADLAHYGIRSRKGDLRATDSWTIRRDQAIALLKDVSTGRASLDQPAGQADDQTSSGEVLVTQQPQVFGGREMDGMF